MKRRNGGRRKSGKKIDMQQRSKEPREEERNASEDGILVDILFAYAACTMHMDNVQCTWT